MWEYFDGRQGEGVIAEPVTVNQLRAIKFILSNKPAAAIYWKLEPAWESRERSRSQIKYMWTVSFSWVVGLKYQNSHRYTGLA